MALKSWPQHVDDVDHVPNLALERLIEDNPTSDPGKLVKEYNRLMADMQDHPYDCKCALCL